MHTRQIVLKAPHRAVVESALLPPLKDGEVLVRVSQCGLCSTEVHQWLGHATDYPIAVGHEIAGVIENARADTGNLQVGDSVVGWVAGGGMAEHVIVRAGNAIPIRPDLPYPAVAEPLSCCVNAVELANPPLGANIVIIGTGFMSHLLQQLSLQSNPRSLIVAGRRRSALLRAHTLGATTTVNLRTEDLSEAVAAATGADGADVTYEATGSQEGLTLAGAVTRTSGTLAIVGYHQDGPRTLDLEMWNRRALRLANAHFRDIATIMHGMRRGIRMVESGFLDPSAFVTHRFSLEEAPDAFGIAAQRPSSFVKAVIEPHPQKLRSADHQSSTTPRG